MMLVMYMTAWSVLILTAKFMKLKETLSTLNEELGARGYRMH